ncbi:lysoplasmalogenase [Legionella parisiensis]|uniref:Putative membrane protein n=1 Tax=Legionella parisiensis TaxID=45071 RepID=A0A1E5JQC2_9GAMM|nr:lysoplasmalogenase [Legionella parisiensis]KTD40255.1 transmembrane protein [Legionella parisiensis]OEH46737.1 putative membrane protein [Legionella parisiensis]STX77633.1 transmembrane protein [Legionella parisiensis]
MPGQPFKITMPFVLLSMILYLLLLSFIQYPLTTLLKPIPIALLMFFVFQVNPEKQIKRLLLLALGFSLLGDVFLTLPIKMAVQVGILAFMATHCSYISLFLKNLQFQRKNLFAFLPILLFVLISFYFLSPYLGEMKLPVAVYLCLLTLMVFCSFQLKQHSLLLRTGACLFLLSDFVLSLDLFILSHNKPIAVLIMLLYYIAQALLVVGITQTKEKVFLELQSIFRGVRLA